MNRVEVKRFELEGGRVKHVTDGFYLQCFRFRHEEITEGDMCRMYEPDFNSMIHTHIPAGSERDRLIRMIPAMKVLCDSLYDYVECDMLVTDSVSDRFTKLFGGLDEFKAIDNLFKSEFNLIKKGSTRE